MMKCVRREDGGEEVVPAQQPILVKHALSMACGLPYGTGFGPEDNLTLTEREMRRVNRDLHRHSHYTLREVIRENACVPLAFEPGSWQYGFGSELSAGLIEGITGKPIGDALCDMLFTPLGMASTGTHYFGDIQDRLCAQYACGDDGEWKPTRLPPWTRSIFRRSSTSEAARACFPPRAASRRSRKCWHAAACTAASASLGGNPSIFCEKTN